jgi:proteic killer suppression protein
MIQTCRDKRTRDFAEGRRVREFEGFRRQAGSASTFWKLQPASRTLQALPSNALEGLKGDRKGQYSIRINMQWRICFEWPDGQSGPSNVEIVDDH